MRVFDSLVDWIAKFIMGISGIILFIVTMLQVASRFIFKNPIPWSQDILRLSFVWLVLIGGAYCVKTNEHLSLDLFLDKLSHPKRRLLRAFIGCILFLFFIFILVVGIWFTKSGITQSAPYVHMPMALYYAAIPVSAALMIYYQAKDLLQVLFEKKFSEGDLK